MNKQQKQFCKFNDVIKLIIQMSPNEIVIENDYESYKLSVNSDFKMRVSKGCMLKITKINKSNARVNIQIDDAAYQVL